MPSHLIPKKFWTYLNAQFAVMFQQPNQCGNALKDTSSAKVVITILSEHAHYVLKNEYSAETDKNLRCIRARSLKKFLKRLSNVAGLKFMVVKKSSSS